MDFKFLLDPERKVFTIGYNVTEGRHDNSFYDLLASEARLASFVAISKSDVSQEHWFRMGRQLTAVDGGRALISWTGTMRGRHQQRSTGGPCEKIGRAHV